MNSFVSGKNGLIGQMVLVGLFGSFLSLQAFGDGKPRQSPRNAVEVIEPPAPSYPAAAAQQKLTGHCMVTFGLREYGSIVDVKSAQCSDPIFCNEAARSVGAAKFRVRDVEGTKKPGERAVIMFPLEFSIPPSFIADPNEYQRDCSDQADVGD